MSASNVNRRIASIQRSIEIIEDKANRIYLQYTGANDDIDRLASIPIDDTNQDLQLFFQHFERLLQIDLKNRKSLLNNKGNYWHFFSSVLKESKGLYDTILYVLNSPEVKTSTGRGRLFIRFCLQHHRLGDVIQQSFMMNKFVHQFYVEDCLWTKSVHMDRVVQVLYQLNDVRFDLLGNGQYQLDLSWPLTESNDIRLRNSHGLQSRFRTNSISSCLSMDSLSGQSIATGSIPIVSSLFSNLEISNQHDGSFVQSMSSFDEDPENSLNYWKDRCRQVEVQCTVEQQDQAIQTVEEEQDEPEHKTCEEQISLLHDEINDLNFQLSSYRIQQSRNDQKIKEAEREFFKQQTLLESKINQANELQRKIEEQNHRIKTMKEEQMIQLNCQEQRIDFLIKENERIQKRMEEERTAFEQERNERKKIEEQLEFSLREKTLDFEEMKRRLIKAIQEKADLFSSIYSYEIKLEEEQLKQWIHEDDVHHCTKCQTAFGWTMRKYRCRNCQKIFCYYCANHWKPVSTANVPQHRLCSFCYDSYIKESLRSDYTVLDDPEKVNSESNLDFQVRTERLTTNDL